MRYIPALLGLLFTIAPCLAQSTGFTYQGLLQDAGQPANGVYDLRFTLFSAATGGTAVSTVACSNDLTVTNGLFTVIVPLAMPTSGADTYLEVQVRPGAAGTPAVVTGYSTLVPRQLITAAPRAAFASAVPAQSPALPGAIRFNPSLAQFEGYNGSYWVAFTTGGTPQEPTSTQDFATPGSQSFIVPAGVTSLGFDLWGSGGGGGGPGPGSIANVCDDADDPFSGGGGGGGTGSYLRATIDVTPGETLTILVGAGGTGGTINGGVGGLTSVARGATVIARAFGGIAGSRGSQHSTVVNYSGLECVTFPNIESGEGGNSRGPVLFVGPGTVIRSQAPANTGPGRGPGCVGYFATEVLCPANGSTGAPAVTSEAPLPVVSAGLGGTGASPGISAAQAGQPGRIRLFWN